MSDIAAEAGVSITTVARVLSGAGRNIRVSEERAKSIRAIAQRLHYQPNITARTLAGSASRVIGVLIDSHAPGAQVRTLAAIEREAGKQGYRIMVGETHNSYERLAESFRVLRQHGVDGVIVMAHDYPDVAGSLDDHLEASSRLVFIDRPALSDANYVQIDRAAGTMAAIRALSEKGRKRIGMIIDKTDFLSVRQRLDGYKAGIRKYAAGQPELICRTLFSDSAAEIRSAVQKAIREFILPLQVDSVIVQNDLYALTLLGMLPQSGLAVPGDVAVIGQDNELFGACSTPSLSSIDENAATTAVQAVRMLLEGLDDPEGDYVARQAIVKPRLILRESV